MSWLFPGAVATRNVALGVIVSGVAIVALSYTLVEWVGTMIALPFNADMLVVIREGTRRFLDGANPYTTYRTYDAPWDMVLPYGPLLWGPYLVPQALHADLRIVTITGELAVPACAAVAAAVEAVRGRVVASLTWLGLLASLILSLHLNAFTLMGHTAAYWPLLPLFAWLVTVQRWPAAALVLGLLVVARTPMVAVVPVLFLTVWTRDRARAWRAAVLFALPLVVLFTPFLLWDARALWHNMVTSYPRIVKAVVWVPPAEGVVNTIGLTGWLVARGLERWVEATQILALIGIYAAAARAIGRGAAPVPWMAAALAVFCMTALWPVFYIYFDVVLLLAAGAAAETLGRGFTPWRWAAGSAGIALAVWSTTLALTQPYPAFAIVPPRAQTAFPLARRVADAAIIEVDAEWPASTPPGTQVTATLNGQVLRIVAVSPGRTTMLLPAPAAAWWRGFNRLDLAALPAPAAAATIHRVAVLPGPRP